MAGTGSLTGLLKRCYIFSELKITQLKNLEKKISIKHFKTGKVLYMEEAPGDHVLLLEAGTVKLTKFMPDGREQILRIVKPVNLMGMEALFVDKYTTTAEAITETTVLAIDKVELKKVIQNDVQMAFKMMQALHTELEAAKRMLCDLGLKTARERMASFLVAQVDPAMLAAETVKLQLDLSRKEIASVLGLTQETVIRILSDFNATKLINLDGKNMVIQNLPRLKLVADSQ
jgi:CRP/FNR family transcriptional regulator